MRDEYFYVGPDYRDPLDARDDVDGFDGPTSLDLHDGPIREMPGPQLEASMTLGAGVEQLLAREELERRAGDGYQASLLGPAEQLALTDRTRRPA